MKLQFNTVRSGALEFVSLLDGLVFFAPVSLLVRTAAGVSLGRFFILQAALSFTVFASEIPCGRLTDRIGYKATLVLSQFTLLAARAMLLAAYLRGSFPLFLLEAVAEGLSSSFSSGTQSAYIYMVFPKSEYAVRSARIANWGTAGFFASTLLYPFIYLAGGLQWLLWLTVAANLAAALVSLRLPAAPPIQRTEKPAAKRTQLMQLFRQKEVPALIVLLAMLSIGRVLVNFFYLEKLAQCGIGEVWLTAVILGYSAVEMLAEPILARTPQANHGRLMALFFLLGGGVLCAIGAANQAALALPAMLVLPLLLDIPSYLLGEAENCLIDTAGEESRRAELLSVFSMGVNAADVIFLLGSSAVANAGAALCFVLLGLVMAITAIALRRGNGLQ